MGHVCADKMASSQSTAKTEFSGKDTGSYDASQLASIVARIRRVCASYTKEIETGALGLEDGATANGADFNAWHRY